LAPWGPPFAETNNEQRLASENLGLEGFEEVKPWSLGQRVRPPTRGSAGPCGSDGSNGAI
jgi:hypothetical protein